MNTITSRRSKSNNMSSTHILSAAAAAAALLLIPCCSAFMGPTTFMHASSSATARLAQSSRHHAEKPPIGSIVTIDCELTPAADFVPESLIDTHGQFTFVLGGGNYLPGLHELVADMTVGMLVDGAELDAGWGSRNPNMIAVIQKKDMQIDVSSITIGTELVLVNGMKARVTDVTDETFTIDANPPMAGASYTAVVELLSFEDAPTQTEYSPQGVDSTYQLATFGLGCFWGGELEFMRVPGVVGTKVGYTQGHKLDPTYEEVCSGTTGHTEAIMVTYDPRVVSYEKLVTTAMDRLGANKFLLNQVGNDKGTQYRSGVYYFNDNQKEIAERILATFGDTVKTECKPAAKWYDAETYHQQYLLKGGQSARKNDDSTIRCYG